MSRTRPGPGARDAYAFIFEEANRRRKKPEAHGILFRTRDLQECVLAGQYDPDHPEILAYPRMVSRWLTELERHRLVVKWDHGLWMVPLPAWKPDRPVPEILD